MKYILLLLLFIPATSFSQTKIDSILNDRGICIPAVIVSTQSGQLIIARDGGKYTVNYKSDNYTNTKKSREMALQIKGVTFHFLDRTLISFKCTGIGKAPRNLSLSLQYNSLKFSAILNQEEFRKLTSKKITTFSVVGENGSTGGDVIFGGFRQDIIDSYYFLAEQDMSEF